ncbi:sulfotransferase family protein [Devosia nitrariae]|uniref:Sulfotransferase family protein n=1 Tax=Devosia nitrariae TaxID=2071872 RepID=A0ABQ5WB49_9HYPH|nr:sulfotransferase family protein [Devosia nitrariae]GLQ56948.1 sulfotransferase family protein [Devosia nitrariae]
MALEIIGAGFGRTGTSSLKVALEHLGFGPVHHMFEVRDNPHLLPPWQAFVEGRGIDWETAFRGYRAQVDWPGAACWRELARDFPDARVILSVRDPDDWFDSVQATIVKLLGTRGQQPDKHINALVEMGHKLIEQGIFGGRLSERAHAIGILNAHIEEVKATIAPARLLVFDVREGWEPLCAFLGCPVPAITFPKLNSSRQFVDEEWAAEEAIT